VTARVVEAVSIPVLASGDIDSFRAASQVVEATGAAAVMVARGVLGDPFLVRRILHGHDELDPSPTELVEDLRALYQATLESMGERRAVPWMRKHVAWHLRRAGVRGADIEKLMRLRSSAEVDEALRSLGAVGEG
jgi:tRNA-dihydrouridine synthase B